MGAAEDRLAELGIELPAAPPPAASYVPFKRSTGSLVFLAGQLPNRDGKLQGTGKLGGEVSLEDGQELARLAAINVLAQAKAAAGGSLDLVSMVKLTVFVASTPDFTEPHLVANGASEFLADVLGDVGLHARSAVGVPVLPLDSPVEVEAIIEIG